MPCSGWGNIYAKSIITQRWSSLTKRRNVIFHKMLRASYRWTISVGQVVPEIPLPLPPNAFLSLTWFALISGMTQNSWKSAEFNPWTGAKGLGATQVPSRFLGQCPWWGPGGKAPGSCWVFEHLEDIDVIYSPLYGALMAFAFADNMSVRLTN